MKVEGYSKNNVFELFYFLCFPIIPHLFSTFSEISYMFLSGFCPRTRKSRLVLRTKFRVYIISYIVIILFKQILQYIYIKGNYYE